MKLQGNTALRFAAKPDQACRLVLIFGEDEGVVNDTASQLIASWTGQDQVQVISLDEDEIVRDPSGFFDALEAVSLLGDKQILRVRARGEKLFAVLKDVLAMPAERLAARLIVQNTSLKTRSKTRTAFEQAPHAAALHVFSDNHTDLISRIRTQLSDENIDITPEALQRFVSGLPGHRSIANSEIEKLILYACDLSRPVQLHDILALSETHADENARTAVQLALSGQSEAAQAEFDRVIDAGLNPISLIRLFEMELSRMLNALALQSEGGPKNVGLKLKPPVWKSEWNQFQQRLDKWPAARLVQLMSHLNDMESMVKSSGGGAMAGPLVRHLFVTCYSLAARPASPQR